MATLVSCGSSQMVTGNDDGIYADDTEQPTRRVVEVNEEEFKEHEENYFKKEVDRLGALRGNDIFTEIEEYSSEDFDVEEEIVDEERPETRITYNNNQPWGFDSDADVVININTAPRWGFNGFYDPYWNNPWGWNNWRWNRWGWRNRWGYNPYWHPYHWNNGFYVGVGIGGFYDPFYCPPFYSPYRYGYYAPYRYGNRYYSRRGINPYRRGYGVASSRRAYSTNRRNTSSRRSSNVYRRSGVNSTRSTRSTRGYTTGGHKPTRNTRSTRSSSTRRNYNSTGGYKPSRNTRASSGKTRSTRNYSTGGYKPSNRSSKRSYTPSRSSRSTRSYTPSRSSRSYSSGRSSSSRSSSRGRR